MAETTPAWEQMTQDEKLRALLRAFRFGSSNDPRPTIAAIMAASDTQNHLGNHGRISAGMMYPPVPPIGGTAIQHYAYALREVTLCCGKRFSDVPEWEPISVVQTPDYTDRYPEPRVSCFDLREIP